MNSVKEIWMKVGLLARYSNGVSPLMKTSHLLLKIVEDLKNSRQGLLL